MSEPRTAAGRRLAEADAQALWSPAEVRAAILAIEAEAADHPPYPTPDEFAGMTQEQFVAFLDRIGVRRFTQPAIPDVVEALRLLLDEVTDGDRAYHSGAVDNARTALAALPAAPAGLDAAWARAEAALPPGGRLTAIFETWGADMHRLGHRGLVRGREDAAAALDDLARISAAAYAEGEPTE